MTPIKTRVLILRFTRSCYVNNYTTHHTIYYFEFVVFYLKRKPFLLCQKQPLEENKMTVIYTSEKTGKEIKLVQKQFFNLYDLVAKHLATKGDSSPPEALKYHDICVGVLNTGDVYIGESCPARIEEYRTELAHQLSEKDMMNQVYAARSFIIKTERSDYDPLPEAVYLEDHGIFSFIGPKDSVFQQFTLNEYLDIDFKIPKTLISVLTHPQGYTAIGYAQAVEYRQSVRLDVLSLLNAHLKICKLTDHYRRYSEIK